MKEHQIYRLAYNLDETKLRGKLVVFYGYRQMQGDIRRAVVRLLNQDGSSGEEWLVNPSHILPL